jgi:hypothetical protein
MVWGPDAQRVWGWKDELPRKGLAWSGRLLRGGRASFLAPDLLADCHPRTGAPDDFRQAPLGEEAHRIAETLLASGPLPTVVLRQAVGLEGRHGGARFSAAVVELGRALVCTSFGAEQVGSGWPSAVLELTAPQTRPSAGKRVACLAVYPTISGVRGMSSHSRCAPRACHADAHTRPGASRAVIAPAACGTQGIPPRQHAWIVQLCALLPLCDQHAGIDEH